jgi:hypothetical protein
VHDIEEERIRSEHNLTNITKAHEKINQEEKVSPYYQVWLILHYTFQLSLEGLLQYYIIFLSSIRSIEACYGRYKAESFHLFKGLPKFLFPLGWYFRIIFGILS